MKKISKRWYITSVASNRINKTNGADDWLKLKLKQPISISLYSMPVSGIE